MFGNWMMRKIFTHKTEEVAGDWRKLHNEELIYTQFLCSLGED